MDVSDGASKERGHVLASSKRPTFRQAAVQVWKWMSESVSAPLMLIYFLMLFINTLLRDTKDTLLVTSLAGVEAIPILKSWAVIPFSFAYFLLYYKVSPLLSPRNLFIAILVTFNMFFFCFALFLYPRQHELVPTTFSAAMREVLPDEAQPLVHLTENWLLGLFYCVAELYASAVCQFLFWQVANNNVSLEEAKSVYPLVGAMGNMGMVGAGYTLGAFANQRDIIAAHAFIRISGQKDPIDLANTNKDDRSASDVALEYNAFTSFILPYIGKDVEPGDTAWQVTLLGMSGMLAVSTIIIIMTYDVIVRRKKLLSVSSKCEYSPIPQQFEVVEEEIAPKQVENIKIKRRANSGQNASTGDIEMSPLIISDAKVRGDAKQWASPIPEIGSPELPKESAVKNKKKPKLSLWESLRMLANTTPLRSAAILVVSYGVSISLVEVSWKGQVKKALESPNDYSRFMGMFWTITGLVSMAFMLIGRIILQKVGYGPAVLFTPASMAIAGTLFFAVALIQDISGPLPGEFVATDSIPWAAYFGGAAVLFAKSAKYAFFDATKEIIFIPLDEESKNLGKAAIDVVAYRLSKSGGSVVLQIVIFLCGSISSFAGILPIALVFGVVVMLWINAAIQANKFIASSSTESNVHIV